MEKKRRILNLSSMKMHPLISHQKTTGEKASDILTKRMGSWTFIFIFILFIILWIVLNGFLLYEDAWDKRPFIMLNLILSCLAALQAPIILMSQNRQAQKDRIRVEYDYAVDRKAEHEIEEIKKQLDKIEKKLQK